MSRQAARSEFLKARGWSSAKSVPLAGDASGRRYFRISQGDATAILMDAPPEPETIEAFLTIDRHLLACGLSAPEILEAAPAQGLLLLEDFGDASFASRLDTGKNEADMAQLYAAAIDVLASLHTHAVPAGLTTYDTARLADEAALFIDTWVAGRTDAEADTTKLSEAHRSFRSAIGPAMEAAWQVPAALSLRDFHAGNLMWLDDRTNLQRVGLLDFQDALVAPVAYDMVSLLCDARHDLPEKLVESMITRYLAARPGVDPIRFQTSYAALGVQRGLRIVGVFTRLAQRDGKPGYLVHLPRVWRQIAAHLTHPDLTALAAWLAEYAPERERESG